MYKEGIYNDILTHFSGDQSGAKLYCITISPYKCHKRKWSYNKAFNDYRKCFLTRKPKVSKPNAPDTGGLVYAHGDPYELIKYYFVLEYHKDGYGHYHGLMLVKDLKEYGPLHAYFEKLSGYEEYFAKSLEKFANVKVVPCDSLFTWINYMTKEVNKTILQNFDAIIYRKK